MTSTSDGSDRAGWVTWTAVRLETPSAEVEARVRFWSGLTGWTPSSPTPLVDGSVGADRFDLVPPGADPFLAVATARESAVVVEVTTTEPAREVRRAEQLGATTPRESTLEVVTPAGLRVVVNGGEPGRRADTHARGPSLVDQACVDVSRRHFASECRFWRSWTGWDLREGAVPHFAPLARPGGIPLRVMVQRVDDDREPATAHLDLASTDRADEVGFDIDELGAEVVRVDRFFTTMVDPTAVVYCVTDRDPRTGTL